MKNGEKRKTIKKANGDFETQGREKMFTLWIFQMGKEKG